MLGKPNVGKSTLLNAFLNEQLSIISPKPQTTRDAILGILSTDTYQIIFVDTPGVHRPRHHLGTQMVQSASEAAADADVLLIMIDAVSGITAEDAAMVRLLKNASRNACWCALVINKTDRIKKNALLPLIDRCQRLWSGAEYIPVSALTRENVDSLLAQIVAVLPPGPAYFPPEQLTDKNERFVVAEYIREQVLHHCQEEVPHAVAVLVTTFKEAEGKKLLIEATVFVERPTQKMIIIGNNGRMLKAIGTAARRQIESFLGKNVYLQLWVKIQKNWRKDKAFLRRLGYLT